MPWTDLYTTILKTECIGSSLSTINTNFDNIDSYLRDLSAEYIPIDSDLTEIATQGSLVQAAARNNLGLGTVATLSDAVAAKAWVNINGKILSPSAMVTNSGTYTRSGSVLTVNITNHGLKVNDYVYLTFPSTPSFSKTVVITSASTDSFTATDQNAFTGAGPFSGTVTSSPVSFQTAPIRSSYNIRKVVRLNDYSARITFAVYFTNNMADANYAALATAAIGGPSADNDNQRAGISVQLPQGFFVSIDSGGTGESSTYINCVVFA